MRGEIYGRCGRCRKRCAFTDFLMDITDYRDAVASKNCFNSILIYKKFLSGCRAIASNTTVQSSKTASD